QLGQITATLDTGIGISLSMIPPCCMERVGFWCRLATLSPSTITFCRWGKAKVTSPCLPRSLPWRTWTRSPLRIFMSEHLRGERHDAHELLVAQLTAHRAEDSSAARGHVVLEQHGGVLVEADVGAVRTSALL